jgi:hypothetical protein
LETARVLFFFFLSFFFCFPWSYGPSIVSKSPEVVSPDDWLIGSILFLLSTGQVAIGTWHNSLTVPARWLGLLILTGHSCIALHLQFWWASSFPRKVGQFSFEYSYSEFPETNSVIYHSPTLGSWGLIPPYQKGQF